MTPALSETQLTLSLYPCSSKSNAPGESKAREGHRASSKSPSKVRDRDEGYLVIHIWYCALSAWVSGTKKSMYCWVSVQTWWRSRCLRPWSRWSPHLRLSLRRSRPREFDQTESPPEQRAWNVKIIFGYECKNVALPNSSKCVSSAKCPQKMLELGQKLGLDPLIWNPRTIYWMKKLYK